MATFDCDLCGKCCRSFGEFVKIERQASDRDYYCRYGITNEIFPVRVQPEYAEEIDEAFTEFGPAGNPDHKGCLFLRRNQHGPGFVCAVYETRPTVCREFRCYRMLIYKPPVPDVAGKVMGTNDLITQDTDLAKLWEEKIAHLPHVAIRSGSPSVSQSAQPSRAAISTPRTHAGGVSNRNDEEWVRSVVTILAAHGYTADLVE